MATEAELIQQSLLNVAQQIADLTASPKPSYSENGRSISWGEHMSNLLALQKQLREQLVMASGPWTINEYR